MSSTAVDSSPYPSRRYAWYVVVLLTFAYAISLLDRWILSLLVGPVKAHFGVSDTQMGLLMGFWFAIFYVSMGLPFGWLADRFDRRRIIALAMAFWCSMTVFCGLARSFGQLAVARLGIGLGEAALTPAANSIIADLFPRAEQNRAITFFNMGISMGMGIAYLVGGAIVAWMALQPPVSLPLFGTLATWQVVFIVAGLPGLLVALLIAALREPVRRERLSTQAGSPRLADCIAYLRANARAYRPLLIGMAASPLVGYAWNWLPTLFDRVWGWNVAQFTGAYGWILIVFGPLGALTGGWLATRWYRAGHREAPFMAALLGLVVMTAVAILLPLAPSAEVAMLLLIPGSWAGVPTPSP
jgi:MFS family permease